MVSSFKEAGLVAASIIKGYHVSLIKFTVLV